VKFPTGGDSPRLPIVLLTMGLSLCNSGTDSTVWMIEENKSMHFWACPMMLQYCGFCPRHMPRKNSFFGAYAFKTKAK